MTHNDEKVDIDSLIKEMGNLNVFSEESKILKHIPSNHISMIKNLNRKYMEYYNKIIMDKIYNFMVSMKDEVNVSKIELWHNVSNKLNELYIPTKKISWTISGSQKFMEVYLKNKLSQQLTLIHYLHNTQKVSYKKIYSILNSYGFRNKNFNKWSVNTVKTFYKKYKYLILEYTEESDILIQKNINSIIVKENLSDKNKNQLSSNLTKKVISNKNVNNLNINKTNDEISTYSTDEFNKLNEEMNDFLEDDGVEELPKKLKRKISDLVKGV